MVINNIKNIGIDLVDKRKFDLNNIFFIKRILTEKEFKIFSMFESNHGKLNFLASRWSAKEAIYKALNDQKTIFMEIEILNDMNGRPYCSSHKDIILSISHTENYSTSIALKLM
ncbi:MAG: 4'-phosphopantetheinyl transferase superfamily protein [Mycoplasmoidaceae bacterium]